MVFRVFGVGAWVWVSSLLDRFTQNGMGRLRVLFLEVSRHDHSGFTCAMSGSGDGIGKSGPYGPMQQGEARSAANAQSFRHLNRALTSSYILIHISSSLKSNIPRSRAELLTQG